MSHCPKTKTAPPLSTPPSIRNHFQMHPLGWSVNRLISSDRFGWDAFHVTPSFFSSNNPGISLLKSHYFSPFLSNVNTPPTNVWHDFTKYVYFDYDTGLALISLWSETQPMTISAVGTMVAALDYISTVNGDNIRCGDIDLEWYIYNTTSQSDRPCWLPVVTYNHPNHEIFQELVDISKSHPYPPALLIDTEWNAQGK